MKNYIYAALFCLLTPAWADTLKDMPKRKSGLWTLTMKMADGPAAPVHMQQCVDEKSDDLMQQQGDKQSKVNCSKNTISKTGTRITAESICKIGQTTATTQAVFSGDFSTAYRGEIRSNFSPPLHGMKESSQTIDAKWTGPCKPGQKPGDVIMPGIGTMNPAEMMKNLPKGAGGR